MDSREASLGRIRIRYPGDTVFQDEITVRKTDLNFGNHLGHDALIGLLGEIRARYFLANGVDEIDTQNQAIMIADLAINYRAEAFFGDVLTVEVALGDTSSHGFELFYRASNRVRDKTVAVARTGHVFFDRDLKRLGIAPPAFRAMIDKPGA